jgi:glycosyltransferase involved in cell wall biosynthesis
MAHDDPPLISVIIPCYNAEAYLAEAIGSALRQEAGPLEIIVVDDGSTDGSARVAQQFVALLRYERQANAGIGAARNRGVELAEGQYVGFLDADDVWPDGSLGRRLDLMRASPGTACVFGTVEEFVSPELGEDVRAALAVTLSAQPARLAGSMLIDRAAFTRVGPFDPTLALGETLDWVARAEHAGIVMQTVDAVVLRRRIHRDNTVTRERARRSDYLRALRAALARRRAGDAVGADASRMPAEAGRGMTG